jgi:hypothetical protein
LLCAAQPLAHAGAELRLVPQTAGPYPPGQIVTVDFYFHPDETETPGHVRLAAFSFHATSEGLQLAPAFNFPPEPNGVELYDRVEEIDPAGPQVYIAWTPSLYVPAQMFEWRPGVPVWMGNIDVTVFETGILDARNLGGSIDDFERGVVDGWNGVFDEYHHAGESLSGGTLEMIVVPEPATALLFGAVAVSLFSTCNAHNQSKRSLLP